MKKALILLALYLLVSQLLVTESVPRAIYFTRAIGGLMLMLGLDATDIRRRPRDWLNRP
jgi:hypothetical protein